MSDSHSPEPVSQTTPNASPNDAPLESTDEMWEARVDQARRSETRRWWIKLFVQPALFVACGALLLIGLGMAQRAGLISGGGSGPNRVTHRDPGTRYICPMMCTPPQAEPGRCPVCAMELVPASSRGVNTDSRSIRIDPATRRVANIRTVAVDSLPVARTIRAVGELRYDEGRMKTISAYVDGRLDRMYADYTGVVVEEGDRLALLYSPRLYSSQVELLLARKARDRARASTLAGVPESGADLYRSAKERLILLGMTESQVAQLEEAGQADSRMHLYAPIGGTVIEKLAVEGQYVKEGEAIYKLADLSTVWLMLQLFPEDAAAIRYGQKVNAEVQSLPGRTFSGRVAFVDPTVDPETRTVRVRVVLPNENGLLRVGDFAHARIEVPLGGSDSSVAYDPELANKWISPRHPQVIAESAGNCPICGVELVPATQFGFTDEPSAQPDALVVPRDAVLMAGDNSVLYVETQPGRFEIRRVVVGASLGDQVVIRSGVAEGEHVATRGNFLIDSQMQLSGNPSLIDPGKIDPTASEPTPPAILAGLSALSPEDRKRAEQQAVCPVAQQRLGSMGTPRKVELQGISVFICCEACRDRLLSEPDKYLARLANGPRQPPGDKPPSGSSPRVSSPTGVPHTSSPPDPDETTRGPRGDHPSVPTTKEREERSSGDSVP